MTKAKAIFVTIVIMGLAGGMLYAFWAYAIRTYQAVIQILGLYGFAVGGVNLARWLEKPEPDKRSEYSDYAEP